MAGSGSQRALGDQYFSKSVIYVGVLSAMGIQQGINFESIQNVSCIQCDLKFAREKNLIKEIHYIIRYFQSTLYNFFLCIKNYLAYEMYIVRFFRLYSIDWYVFYMPNNFVCWVKKISIFQVNIRNKLKRSKIE